MAGDATGDVGRWRQAPAEVGPTNTRARKWFTAAWLTLLLLALAAGAIYLLMSIFVLTGPRPYLVPLWNARYQRPQLAPIPWMEADRRAMEDGAYFADVAPRGFGGLTLEEVNSQLAALRDRPRSGSVVVYAASYALVDPSGAVRLLAKDSDPSDPKTSLPLRDLLAALKACPAGSKLLVLDINRADPSPGETGAMETSDGVADLIKEEVAAAEDGALLVLSSASPGQTSLAPEALGRSLFNRQFCQALDDPAADGDGNGQVSVVELAAFLGQSADRWAQHYRGTRQQPFLTGGGPDFPLIALNRARPKARPAPAPVPATKAEAPAETAKASTAPADATAKAAPAAPAVEGPVYPQWLADAWARRAKWWAEDAPVVSPRAARVLDATLLRAERDWRGGADPEALRAEVVPLLASIEAERAKAAEVPRPPARSVGQARALGAKADPALVAPLKGLLRLRRDPDPTAKPEEAAASAKMSADEFLAGLKGKTSLDLALAVVAASAEERLVPEVVTALDSIVDAALKADASLQRDVIELRFLHHLAGRAAVAKGASGRGEWSEATARTAWEAETAAEEAGSRFESLAWVRRPLDRADATRHEATVLLLPTAAGMADWGQIGEAWDGVRDAYEFVTSLQTRLTRARVSLARARSVLAGHIAYLESSGHGGPNSLWHDAAAAAGRLAPLLTPPDESSDASLEHLNNDLAEATRRLDGLTAELLVPFRHEALAELAARSVGDRPDPKLAPAIDAVLSTPFPSPEDRRALLSAARTLHRRLADLPSNEPAVESDGTADSDRADAAARVAARRGRVAADLLALAGVKQEAALTGEAPAPVGSNLGKTWGALSAALTEARGKLLAQSLAAGPGGDDRAGAVAPVSGLDWRFNPARLRREADARAAWNRLGSRYLDARHDLGDSDQFYEKAGLECLQIGLGSPPEGALEMTAEPASQDLTLSADRGEATASALLTWHGSGSEPETRTLSVVAPGDSRFRVALTSGPEVKLLPGTPLAVTARVSWNDDSGSATARPPAGFILRARRADGRSDHLMIPVSVSASSERLRIVLSDDAKQVNPQPFDLRLRPLAARQSFYLHVKNPTSAPRNVLVRVVAGAETAGETVLGESKLSAAAGRTTVVPAFAAAPVKPADPLAPVPEGLRIVLLDGATNKVLDQQTLKPSIATPLEYLKVMRAEFRPARPGEPNRLSVTLRAQPNLTGPPCPVELVVARDAELFPALLSSPKGRLSGALEPAGDLTVYAEQLVLEPSAPRDGVFRLDLDGQKRALSFKARFPLQGGPQEAALETTPRVRFSALPEVKPDQPARLNVRFLVDNAPPDAKVEFRLGRPESDGLSDDISPWVGPAKQRRVGFDPRGENGALLFEVKVADWSHSFVTAGIRGRRTLQARLLDADGRTLLDSSTQTLTLDDLPPQEVAFGLLPPQVARGTASIPVSAVAAVPASSVKEMTFFVGKPADYEKAVAAGASARGKATPGDPSTWAAELPLPATAASPLVISVRVVSGVDLVGFASQEIDLTAAKPSEEDVKAKKEADASRPGTIEGKVAQGNLPQPNIVVTLTDLAPKPDTDAKAGEVKTGKDGAFSFKDIKPGKYRLSARNQASLTRAGKDVTVEPAKTAKADLELFR